MRLVAINMRDYGEIKFVNFIKNFAAHLAMPYMDAYKASR